MSDSHVPGRVDRRDGATRTVVNTHLHLPPNFSAFRTVADAVETGRREGVCVMGASNFYDLGVYAEFAAAAERVGIVPLFGTETICLVGSLQEDGIRVNDPDNPGRMYLCGKGIGGFDHPSLPARHLMAAIRTAAGGRMRRMVESLDSCFADGGFDPGLTADSIASDVADRAGVLPGSVVLQERHLALAFQEALFGRFPVQQRQAFLERVLRRAPVADVADPVAVQGELRSRLMKAHGAAFEPESPVSFDDAYRLVLELDGIPCYPTLGDGVSPVCPWEEPPTALAERVLERGIHVAELIPTRNQSSVVDAYVAAFRAAGILVLAGTEHNTQQRIPLEPRCADGSLPSVAAREAFWEATSVVAAHQHLRSSGRHGYVDPDGRLEPGFPDGESRIRWFRELGAELIASAAQAVSG